MYQRFAAALRNLHLGQGGLTGVTTAIILIAFVTVASVLAYSVLSAGIFSAERAKETVLKGLEGAQSSLEITSDVLGMSENQTRLETVQFFIGLTIPNEKLDTRAIVVNYWDKEAHAMGCTTTIERASDSPERGATSMIEADEQFRVTVTIPVSADAGVYETFTVQVLAPTGGALTIERTLPGTLSKVMSLQ